MMKGKKPILLVEDDTVDTMTVTRALKEIHVSNRLINVSNGKEALEYLMSADNEKPCIILLDLNMPKMNGFEFLHAIKKDDLLKMIPIVILTTSKEEQDKIDSFKLSVAGYMIKPVDYQKFVDVMRTINVYWTLSELPEEV
jgi:CheY-like chemotaxis protein